MPAKHHQHPASRLQSASLPRVSPLWRASTALEQGGYHALQRHGWFRAQMLAQLVQRRLLGFVSSTESRRPLLCLATHVVLDRRGLGRARVREASLLNPNFMLELSDDDWEW